MVKDNLNSVHRQFHQISEGGLRVLYRKMEKMFWLLFMNVAAPLAVLGKWNWPKAYLFIGKKNQRTLRKLHLQARPDDVRVDRVMKQALACFKVIVERRTVLADDADWITANRALADLYFLEGKMAEMNDLFKKEAEVLCHAPEWKQLDDLGLEFLPEFLSVASIGTYEFLEAYVKARILGLRPAKKPVLLLNPKATVNNRSYLNYWRRYITIITDPSLFEVLMPLQKKFGLPLNYYMHLNAKVYKGFLAIGKVRELWSHTNRASILTLSDEDYMRGWQSLKSLGIQQDDWFVCLHVREGGWKDRNSPTEDFRNADIRTYQSAIKSVTDAGGWVVRMGDTTMQPLPDMPHVLDYAHSDAKSDWMDVFLCAQCRFFIGTSSGLYTFAAAFGVPVIMTNLLPACSMYYFSSQDLFIPRLCRYKHADRRFVSFTDLLSPSVGTAIMQNRYDQAGVETIENTEGEIKDLVDEMIERCTGVSNDTAEDKERQRQFQALARDCGKLYGDEGVTVTARIGKKFLSKYSSLLPADLDTGAVMKG